MRANLTRNGIARGGSLTITDRRLVFQPSNFEAMLRVKPHSWPLDQIARVGTAPQGRGPFSGAWVQRLALQMNDGAEALLVVPDVDEVVREIEALI